MVDLSVQENVERVQKQLLTEGYLQEEVDGIILGYKQMQEWNLIPAEEVYKSLFVKQEVNV